MNATTLLAVSSLVALTACGSEVRDDTSAGGGSATGQGGGATSGTATTTGGGVTSTSGSSTSSSTTSSSASTGNGGGPSFAACDTPGTCVLAQKDCCGPCGDPDVSDYDAIRRDAADAHFGAVCPDPGGTPCPGCAVDPDPDLFAYCDLEAGRCVGADLPRTELAACETAADCTLRSGTGCCEWCGEPEPWVWVALRADAVGDLLTLVCAPDVGCPECEPSLPPEGMVAECLDGVCSVVILEGAPR